MKMTINKDGFHIDTKQGLKIRLDNDDLSFFAGNRNSCIPADDIPELIHHLELAYKLLIDVRIGDVELSDFVIKGKLNDRKDNL